MEQIIYLDHAATTYVLPEVLDEMLPYFTQNFGNPSSAYKIGQQNKRAIQSAREKVAKAIGAQPDEIYFTAGGTEADNWAIKGISLANRDKGNHIITTAIEHHAITETVEYLGKRGFEFTILPVQTNGIVDLKEVEKAIRPNTILISVMYANNEIGTIQPIKQIAEIAKANNIYFHTDAVQAVGAVPIDVKDLGVDLLSLSAHKFYGPKGVGVLYIKKGTKIDNLLHGGAQEKGKRASTENLTGIIGLGKAIELAVESLEEKNNKIASLRDYLVEQILAKIPYTWLNGDTKNRLPSNANISFEYIEGESLLIMLDAKGIQVSTGSACASGSLDPSHVLLAIGLPHEKAHGTLRFSLGIENTKDQMNYVVESLVEIVERLRSMSPLYAKRV